MKNKKLIYILLPIVLLIWGAIVYKVLANYLENDSSSLNSKNDDITSIKISKTDTFSLMLNYSDPFLKEGVSVSVIPVSDYSQSAPVKQVIATVKEKKDNTTITWPTIIYCGLIKNKLSNKTCSIIKINGAEHLMNVGDTYSDVSLIKIFKDSAIVQYKNIKKTLTR